MEHKIKELASAITNTHTSNLVQSHVKELKFENNHLTIYVDNAGPLHELESEENDHHLQSGMEKIYGDISYELKIMGGGIHERENLIPHEINQ
jgi:FtsZ-binding cell division protein ZapB